MVWCGVANTCLFGVWLPLISYRKKCTIPYSLNNVPIIYLHQEKAGAGMYTWGNLGLLIKPRLQDIGSKPDPYRIMESMQTPCGKALIGIKPGIFWLWMLSAYLQVCYSYWLPWAVTQSNPFCQSCQSSWKSACQEPGSRCFMSKEEVLLAFVPKAV